MTVPTIAASLQTAQRKTTTWVGIVTSINYTTRTLTANLDGDSGPDRIRIPDHFDFGNAQNPKLGIGSMITVERIGNDYFASLPLGRSGSQLFMPLVATHLNPPLAQPQWATGYPRAVGTNIEGVWSVVMYATKYRVYSNTSPTLNGATLIGEFITNQFSKVLNTGITSEIITVNQDFERGDLTGWTPVGIGWTISADKHAGTFSAHGSENSGHGRTIYLDSDYYRIVPGASYTFSAWIKVPWCSFAGFEINATFKNAGDTFQTVSLYSTNSILSTWTNIVVSVTAPSFAQFVLIDIVAFGGGGGIDAYVDDVSLIGPAPIQSDYLFYAVRALDNANNISPLSPWLQATVQNATVGNPSADHTQIDYANAAIQSSNFLPATAGYKVSPQGVEGACVISATEPTTKFPGLLWLDTST